MATSSNSFHWYRARWCCMHVPALSSVSDWPGSAVTPSVFVCSRLRWSSISYVSATAALVPKWNCRRDRCSGAIATTLAFGFAGVALLGNIKPPIAARLTTAMVLGFLLLIWLPALFANPHRSANWAEAAETLAIAASAWVVADFFGRPIIKPDTASTRRTRRRAG